MHLLAGESAQQAPHAGAQVLVLFGAHPSSLRVLTNAATTSDYPKLGDACVHHSTSLSTGPRNLGCSHWNVGRKNPSDIHCVPDTKMDDSKMKKN